MKSIPDERIARSQKTTRTPHSDFGVKMTLLMNGTASNNLIVYYRNSIIVRHANPLPPPSLSNLRQLNELQ